MFERIQAKISTDPYKYNFPVKNETLKNYTKRQLRNIGKHWNDGDNILYLSKNCYVPFDTEKLKGNLNTIVQGASIDEWRIFIETQIAFSDANFVIPVLPYMDIDLWTKILEDRGYIVCKVSDEVAEFDELLDNDMKFAIFYDFQSSILFERFLKYFLHKIYSVIEKKKNANTIFLDKDYRQTMIFYEFNMMNDTDEFNFWLATCCPYHINFIVHTPSLKDFDWQDPYLRSNFHLLVIYELKEKDKKIYPWIFLKNLLDERAHIVPSSDKTYKRIEITIRYVYPALPEQLKDDECLVYIGGSKYPLLVEKCTKSIYGK